MLNFSGSRGWTIQTCRVLYNAAFIHNSCPTRDVYRIMPKERWNGKRPCISYLNVFGCIVLAKVPNETRSKLDAKGIKHLLLR